MTSLIDLITPLNLREEKEKFFASATYHPIFKYEWQNREIHPEFVVKKKLPLWKAVRAQNYQEIVRCAADLFEVEITDEQTKEATKIARTKGRVYEGSAEGYAQLLRKDLDQFGLTDFKIEIADKTGFNSRPNHKAGKIFVSKDIHFGYFSMDGGVHHEMVHIIRYQNGKFNSIEISERFLPTEEGLASWCQDNTNDDNGHAQHAIEYVASAVGVKGSLRDIYNLMRDMGMDKELAWKRTCRHKFGFVQTSEPGDILKPAMYFDNEEKVAKLSTNERVRLFVGKINRDELNKFPKYHGRWDEEQIRKYFHL